MTVLEMRAMFSEAVLYSYSLAWLQRAILKQFQALPCRHKCYKTAAKNIFLPFRYDQRLYINNGGFMSQSINPDLSHSNALVQLLENRF